MKTYRWLVVSAAIAITVLEIGLFAKESTAANIEKHSLVAMSSADRIAARSSEPQPGSRPPSVGESP